MQIIPQAVTDAANQLSQIGENLAEVSASAVFPTTQIIPAAADEVSTAISALFSGQGALFQELSAQAESFHQGFVNLLSQSANAYSTTDSASAAAIHPIGTGEDFFHILFLQGILEFHLMLGYYPLSLLINATA